MKPEALTQYIHKHIPLTKHLGAVVRYYNGNEIEISAPLEPNLNHRKTAFGGSISAIGILSGWALLFMKLRDTGLKTRLVIQHSSFDFVEPMDGDFKAICAVPEAGKWERFINTLKRHGKARITVDSRITSAHNKGGNHSGTYVAILLQK